MACHRTARYKERYTVLAAPRRLDQPALWGVSMREVPPRLVQPCGNGELPPQNGANQTRTLSPTSSRRTKRYECKTCMLTHTYPWQATTCRHETQCTQPGCRQQLRLRSLADHLIAEHTVTPKRASNDRRVLWIGGCDYGVCKLCGYEHDSAVGRSECSCRRRRGPNGSLYGRATHAVRGVATCPICNDGVYHRPKTFTLHLTTIHGPGAPKDLPKLERSLERGRRCRSARSCAHTGLPRTHTRAARYVKPLDNVIKGFKEIWTPIVKAYMRRIEDPVEQRWARRELTRWIASMGVVRERAKNKHIKKVVELFGAKLDDSLIEDESVWCDAFRGGLEQRCKAIDHTTNRLMHNKPYANAKCTAYPQPHMRRAVNHLNNQLRRWHNRLCAVTIPREPRRVFNRESVTVRSARS